jgi:hypothetical protein
VTPDCDSVCAEYDESPVGPHREYVTMGSLVTKRGAFGQWGSRLYVSTAAAEEVCQRTWGVPAEQADITFSEGGTSLCVAAAPPLKGGASAAIAVSGWQATRSAAIDAPVRGGLPVLWTPQIKALWAPLVPLPAASDAVPLSLCRLRLSAKSLRLHWCGQSASSDLGSPLPIGLSVDGVRIEIGKSQEGAAGL